MGVRGLLTKVRMSCPVLNIDLSRELCSLLWPCKQLQVDLLDSNFDSVRADSVLPTDNTAKGPLTKNLQGTCMCVRVRF